MTWRSVRAGLARRELGGHHDVPLVVPDLLHDAQQRAVGEDEHLRLGHDAALPGCGTACPRKCSLRATPTGAGRRKDPLYNGAPGEPSREPHRVLTVSSSPATSPSRLAFSLALEPSRLLRARQRIRDYLDVHGAAPHLVDEVVLAIEEAMTNAVRHSGGCERLDVRLGFEGCDLTAEVRDHGAGFDVTRFDPQVQPELLATGGRGLYLISRLMDGMELRSNDGDGLAVLMRKAGALADGAQAPQADCAIPEGDELSQPRTHRTARERTFVESIGEGFAALDWEYRFVYANDLSLELYGMSREAVIGTPVWELFSSSARRRARARLYATPWSLARPPSWSTTRPSRSRYLEYRVYPTRSGISFYARDIDERKRKELALDEARRRAELLARTTARLLSTDDPQGIIVDLCREVMEHLDCHVFFNYLTDERSGRLRLNAYGGVKAQQAAQVGVARATVKRWAAWRPLEARPVVCEDVQHSADPRADLVRRYGVQVHCAHPLTARGRVLGTLSFGARDRARFTTEEMALMATVADYVAIALDRQRTEQALRASEDRQAFLLRHAPAAIYEMDYRNGRFISVNDFMCQVTGYTREELLAMHPLELLIGADREVFRERIRSTLAGEATDPRAEYRVLTKQGDERYAIVNASPLFEDGVPTGAFIVAHDVTERHHAEQALRESEARFRLALRNAPVSVAAQDLDLAYTWAYNQKTAPPGGIVGRRDGDIYLPTRRSASPPSSGA